MLEGDESSLLSFAHSVAFAFRNVREAAARFVKTV